MAISWLTLMKAESPIAFAKISRATFSWSPLTGEKIEVIAIAFTCPISSEARLSNLLSLRAPIGRPSNSFPPSTMNVW